MKTVEVGEVIAGKYRVTRILGQGGMGLVVAAQHLDLGEALVALKFRLPLPHDTPEAAARFAREALTVARLKNDHVARMHDVGKTADGTPFLVMEYLDGRDLAQVIRDRGPLPIEESVDLLLQACEAIAEAHTLGIVHRDLKPSNLFVTPTPDGARVLKVLDFGISKIATADEVAVTGSAGLLGSVLYMSPEQIASARSVDPRADVWALGVILYEMLSGTTPFAGDSAAAIGTAILNNTFSKLSDRRKDLPNALDEVVSDALTKDREVRLSSVEAFGSRLAPFGTAAARASLARIRGIVAVAAEGAGQPGDSADGEAAPGGGARDDATVHGQSTQPAVVQSAGGPEPRPRRWRWAAGIGVATAAAFAVLFPPVRDAWSDAAGAWASALGSPASSSAGAVPCGPGGVAACEAKCAAKDQRSCYELAHMLAKGTDAPKDLPRAVRLYQATCDSGVPEACGALGILYANGDGVGQDAAKAVELYQRSCDQGFALGCVNLGSMHYTGAGLPENPSNAVPLFVRGCDEGEPVGCFNLSIAYGAGKGVPRDAEQSVAYAERACAGGYLQGCVRVGMTKVSGDGVPKDVKAGLAQLDALCTKGEAEACEHLVGMYVKGVGTDVPADPARTQAYARKGCKLGSEKACVSLRVLMTIASGETTPARIVAWFAKQCDEGDLFACGMLGEDLVEGKGAGVDKARGMALLEKACAGKQELACTKLAQAKGGAH